MAEVEGVAKGRRLNRAYARWVQWEIFLGVFSLVYHVAFLSVTLDRAVGRRRELTCVKGLHQDVALARIVVSHAHLSCRAVFQKN